MAETPRTLGLRVKLSERTRSAASAVPRSRSMTSIPISSFKRTEARARSPSGGSSDRPLKRGLTRRTSTIVGSPGKRAFPRPRYGERGKAVPALLATSRAVGPKPAPAQRAISLSRTCSCRSPSCRASGSFPSAFLGGRLRKRPPWEP